MHFFASRSKNKVKIFVMETLMVPFPKDGLERVAGHFISHLILLITETVCWGSRRGLEAVFTEDVLDKLLD